MVIDFRTPGASGGGNIPSGNCLDFSKIGYTDADSDNADAVMQGWMVYSETKKDEWNPENTSAANLYARDYQLVFAPMIYTSKVTDFSSMYSRCYQLVSVPQLDTSKGTTFNNFLSDCTQLKIIPNLDFQSATNMSWAFSNVGLEKLDDRTFPVCTDASYMLSTCNKLVSIGNLDFPVCTNFSYMFDNCSLLKDIERINTPEGGDMSYMFSYCSGLTSIPNMDYSKALNLEGIFMGAGIVNAELSLPLATRVYGMFWECQNLESAVVDIPSATVASGMFYNCRKLKSVELKNTSKLEQVDGMFFGCIELDNLPEIDLSSCTEASNMFRDYGETFKITNMGGFPGLKTNLDLYECPNLTKESLMNVINKMADLSGVEQQTLTLGETNLAKLSEEEKAVATTKNWILA